MPEEWCDIPGWEGLYQVSSMGRVRSLLRRVRHWAGRHRVVGGRILQGEIVDGGYVRVTLSDGDRQLREFSHRLVLLAFVGPCPDGMETCHNNGKRDDNRLDNLRWDTRRANQQDRIRHGTDVRGDRHWARRDPERWRRTLKRIHRNREVARGERAGAAKLTEQQVREIRARYRKGRHHAGSACSLAQEFGVSNVAITNIVKGKTWRHIE